MHTTYAIDGYNLLHAMGVLGDTVGPGGLERARTRLLGLLHAVLQEHSTNVTVVFDSARALPGVESEQTFRGIHVLFARDKEEADDVIERLIRQSSAPKALVVVSDDHRVQKAARRRDCQARGCEAFLLWLDRYRQQKNQGNQEQPEKQDALAESEVKRWLAEFADVERDPSLKDAFESFDFEKEL